MNVFLFLYVHILFPLFLKFWNKRPASNKRPLEWTPPKISDFKINAPGVYSRKYGIHQNAADQHGN